MIFSLSDPFFWGCIVLLTVILGLVGMVVLDRHLSHQKHFAEKLELHHQIESLTAGLLARNTSEYRDLKNQATKGQIERVAKKILPESPDDMDDISEIVPVEDMDEDDFSQLYKTRHPESF